MRINITLTNEKGEVYTAEVDLTKISGNKQIKKIGAKESNNKNKSKLSSSIDKIYKNGFFKNTKKLGDVMTELTKIGYNFKKGSVYRSLNAANFLDKTGKKGDYGWIQKYPPE